MKKSLLMTGMLALVLTFGMMVVGCDEPPTDGKVIIGNNSANYTITRIRIWGGSTEINEAVSLKKGQERSWTLPIGDYKFSVEVNRTGGPALKELNATILSNQTINLLEGVRDQVRTKILHSGVQEEYKVGATVIREEGINFFWLENRSDAPTYNN
jgi:hypothetical protein